MSSTLVTFSDVKIHLNSTKNETRFIDETNRLYNHLNARSSWRIFKKSRNSYRSVQYEYSSNSKRDSIIYRMNNEMYDHTSKRFSVMKLRRSVLNER